MRRLSARLVRAPEVETALGAGPQPAKVAPVQEKDPHSSAGAEDHDRERVAVDDGDFVFSRQVNLETIHDHDVLAERGGTVGELRTELAGSGVSQSPTELADWLRS